MRLAIADPPYLGRADMLYGEGTRDVTKMNATGALNPSYRADRHPEAHLWDDPATHEALVARLVANYDGWAVAMAPDNLRHYLRWTPTRTRVAVWHDPRVMPTGAHPRRRWEPVLVYVPDGRRRVIDVAHPVGDVLTCPHPGGSFAGSKPRQWTRWVLDMLGYDAEADSIDDLFGGSGAVTWEVAQGVLKFDRT